MLDINSTTLNARLTHADISTIVLENASAHPDRNAVVTEGVAHSYKELAQKIRSIAGTLPKSCQQNGALVGVMMPRGFDLVATLLAVNFTGAAYVPLDPSFPADRLKYIIEDAKLQCVLCSDSAGTDILPVNCQAIDIRSQAGGSFEQVNDFDSTDLAYSIYTSGSTGNPKGVLIPKSALNNFLISMSREPGICQSDMLLAVTTPSFDIAALEIFLPLLCGATILIASEIERKDGARLTKLLSSYPVTIMQATPATWQMVLDAGWNGDRRTLKILCGGEALTHRLAAQLLENASELWNMYGPTETTIWSSCKRIEDVTDDRISAGPPIDNTYFLILDENRQRLPDGESGGLYIGGDGLADGYSSDVLTKEKFIPDPFRESGTNNRLYETGDRALIRDGELFVEGRLDSQIKVRGYRVEPAEIEANLEAIEDIKQAVVVLLDRQNGQHILCAALRVGAKSRFESSVVIGLLRKKLPDYMLPDQLICVSEFPKTPNGKVDRRGLVSKLNAELKIEDANIPQSASDQELMVALVKSAIGLSSVGATENLFDHGLTSIQANWVAAQMSSITGRRLSVTGLFENPTIEGFLKCREEETPPQSSIADGISPQRRVSKSTGDADIAIIGMSGRFPGADTIDELWDLVSSGEEGITTFQPDEDDPVAKVLWGDDPGYKRVRGMIKNPELFDADLFGINPNDAAAMDPQQRVFLELAWEAFEHSGYGAGHEDLRVGCFAGMGNNFYYHYNVSTHQDHIDMIGSVQAEIGREKDHIATLVSYKLNLKGPSLSIHTACSTALVAIDSACQALLSDQCDMALAGGIELRTPQFSGQVHEPGGIFTADGHCRPFSDQASGTMFSDSAGILILKRLSDAERDNDTIHAVIKGSATNHDGQDKKSYLAPSIKGQVDVIETALKRADISAATVSYMEAHGTGTLVGDPIEFEALRRVFENADAPSQNCAIGSVKANIGHPTTAAGVVGVIKSVLCMKHQQIPPLANFTGINPNIDIRNSPFFVPEKSLPWKRGDGPRRAGVSSFGFCGTNAHVVLEEYEHEHHVNSKTDTKAAYPLIISAKNKVAAEELRDDILNALSSRQSDLGPTSYTLSVGRKRLDKGFVIAAHRTGKTVSFSKPLPLPSVLSGSRSGSRSEFNGKIGFLFPGQGSQYIGMGKMLCEREPAFKSAFDECMREMSSEMGEDLEPVMFGSQECKPDEIPAINNTFYTQPAIFCLEYALARLWQSWGLNPDFIIGHSIGEFVGATIAGVFDLSEGVKAIAARGRLVRNLPGGSMLSVRVPAADIAPLIPKNISLAAVNSPGLCVVAGIDGDIEQFSEFLERKNIHNKRLHTSHAFHSWMMDDAVEPLEKFSMTSIPNHLPYRSFHR